MDDRPIRRVEEYRLEFDRDGNANVSIPEISRVLSIQYKSTSSFDMPTMWALVEPSERNATLHFQMFATGDSVPDHNHLVYIATLSWGSMTFHVFQKFPSSRS